MKKLFPIATIGLLELREQLRCNLHIKSSIRKKLRSKNLENIKKNNNTQKIKNSLFNMKHLGLDMI